MAFRPSAGPGSSMSRELALAAGYEAIQHRQSLAPLLQAAFNAGGDLLGGLIEVLCVALDGCQRAGVTFDWKNLRAKQVAEALPSARRLLLAAMCSGRVSQDTADVLSSLVGAVYQVRDRVSVSAPTQRAAAESAPAADAPVMLVRVVGMPDREISTTVNRSDDGNIVGSETTKRDAATRRTPARNRGTTVSTPRPPMTFKREDRP